MTESSIDDIIPKLEEIDQGGAELAEMANEANYCKCPGAKTKGIIKKK